MGMMVRFSGVFLFFWIISLPTLAAEPLINKPVYNPETKSYFEYYIPLKHPDISDKVWSNLYAINWESARIRARQKVFKGVRGRLAIVDRLSTHEFLLKTFHAHRPAWIGLRWWCKYRKFEWVTGQVYPRTGFFPWYKPWNSDGASPGGKLSTCNYKGYMGIHYWPVSHGFRWNANGSDKEWQAMFVEYPTGRP